MSTSTEPEVFIIESLRRKDEKDNHYEGQRLSDMLHLSGKKCHYTYIRTVQELEELIREFKKSNYRYLHLSCHGSADEMSLTFDEISLEELGELLEPVLMGRRLFVSACSMTNWKLAKSVMRKSRCVSLMGPDHDVFMDDAALFWASFYHIMFRENKNYMNTQALRKNAQKAAQLFKVPINVFTCQGKQQRIITRNQIHHEQQSKNRVTKKRITAIG